MLKNDDPRRAFQGDLIRSRRLISGGTGEVRRLFAQFRISRATSAFSKLGCATEKDRQRSLPLSDSVRRGQKFFVVFDVVFVRDARNTCDNEIVMAIRLNRPIDPRISNLPRKFCNSFRDALCRDDDTAVVILDTGVMKNVIHVL